MAWRASLVVAALTISWLAFGSADGLRRLKAGEDPASIAASGGAAEGRWRTMRAKYILY